MLSRSLRTALGLFKRGSLVPSSTRMCLIAFCPSFNAGSRSPSHSRLQQHSSSVSRTRITQSETPIRPFLSNKAYPYLVSYRNKAPLTFLLFLIAKSNANLAILSALALVETFKLSTTPGKLWCSNPEYSPSVFSRMMAKSTLSCRVGKPGRDLQTTTEA